MREKAPAPAKYAPYAFAVRSLRDKPLLALCYAYGCEVRLERHCNNGEFVPLAVILKNQKQKQDDVVKNYP